MSASGGVGADGRDFAPAWHLKTALVCAAILLAAILAAWRIFL